MMNPHDFDLRCILQLSTFDENEIKSVFLFQEIVQSLKLFSHLKAKSQKQVKIRFQPINTSNSYCDGCEFMNCVSTCIGFVGRSSIYVENLPKQTQSDLSLSKQAKILA